MPYYAISIFISAFLLFQIQPMISKYILPWFGGTPSVWSTTLLFFQVLLTGGYAYAYWLIGRLKSQKQGIVHMGLLAMSLVLLIVTGLIWNSPITPDSAWKPEGGGFPIFQVLKILAVAVGVPYFLLATNSVLMQAWFNRDHPGRSPYRLYSLSNIGSLLALISYPFLVEPNLTLRTQANTWSLGYALFALLAIYGAFKTYNRKQAKSPKEEAPPAESVPETGRLTKVLWLLLPASASVILLAITNQITQEVAVIPFLWVLPLTIYLLSFILAFDNERWYSRFWFTVALIIMSGFYIWLIIWDPDVYFQTELVIYSLLLFVCCMICHGELVKLRPDPQRLTSFYLMVSVGGALGGIFVNLIAPFIFTGYFELQWGIFACWLLLTFLIIKFKPPTQRKRTYQAIALVMILLSGTVGYYSSESIKEYSSYTLYETRNYYGILYVTESNIGREDYHAFKLTNGQIDHENQLINPDLRDIPTSYYNRESGVGLAFLVHPNRPNSLKVGGIGLGVGTIAAYIEPGDSLRFYEINPSVVALAEGQDDYFSYLTDAEGELTVILGDARLSLEKELNVGQNQEFDLLVVDAFTSDAIPVHLLTREAFEIYLQHLKTNGILAIHISNRHLDLRPVVVTAAQEFGLSYAVIEHESVDDQSNNSTWMILTRDQEFFDNPHISLASVEIENVPDNFRMWTDDYSNLFKSLY
ncbi:MAG: fused MFS/spermidine synthase [Anaerolineae bacterium]|nr:fused MFS/spermidine synthase [Anaerolineae bacterium]